MPPHLGHRVEKREDLNIGGVGSVIRLEVPRRVQVCMYAMGLVGLSVALDAVVFGVDVGD